MVSINDSSWRYYCTERESKSHARAHKRTHEQDVLRRLSRARVGIYGVAARYPMNMNGSVRYPLCFYV